MAAGAPDLSSSALSLGTQHGHKILPDTHHVLVRTGHSRLWFFRRRHTTRASGAGDATSSAATAT